MRGYGITLAKLQYCKVARQGESEELCVAYVMRTNQDRYERVLKRLGLAWSFR